jgi:hypothetical protein
VALRPQPPAPQFFEPPVQPVPLRGLWTGVAAAALIVLAFIGGAFKEIAARWRGIVLAHIFFLTLWLAIQVFFFATGAYWCFPSESPKWVEGLSKYFPHISRCLPTVSSHASLGSPSSLAVSSVSSPTGPPSGSSSASVGSPAAPSSASRTIPSSGSTGGPFHGSTTNCWRDRSLSGNCFARAEPHRKLPPPRFRSPGPSAFPCRRSSNCWSDAI